MNCKTNASAPSGSSDIVSKTFTANGTYNATDEGYDGYNPVTVNVSITPPSPTGYIRPTGVPNGEDIIANAPDIEQGGVTYKPIYYICAMDTFNSNTFTKTGYGVSTGADAYVFSDEPSTLYVGDTTHTFNRSLDFATDEKWNCRYIIMYATAANKANVNGITVNLCNYRATFEFIGASGTIFSNTTPLFGSASTDACQSIKYVDISACSFYLDKISAVCFMGYNQALTEIKLPESITTVNGNYFCYYCYSLTALSLPKLTTVSGQQFCYYCYSLTALSLPKLTTVSGQQFCNYCYSLTSLSLPALTTVSGQSFCFSCCSLTSLSLPNLTTAGNSFCSSFYSLTSLSLPNLTTAGNFFCNYCYSLTSLSLPALTTVSGQSFCSSCRALSYVDLSALTSLPNTNPTTLNDCRYIKLHTDFDIDAVIFTGSTGYTKSLDWLNNELPAKLKDNSGGTAKKMTLGAANIALIGTTAAAIIAAKNWTIA